MSNNYFHQNYHPNAPQTQGQQYSTYQTAPSPNNAPSTRQYQQPSATNAQSTDYLTYNRAQPYSGQANQYGGQQTGSWTGASYGGTREQTRGAAEALSNLSNSAYSSGSNPARNSPNFAPATAASARYTPTTPVQPHQTQQQGSTGSSHAAGHSYGQVQAQAVYQQQQQRSNSPQQMHYGQVTPASAASTRASNMTSTSYTSDYSHRQLPSVDAPRAAQAPNVSASYAYTDAQATAPAPQATSSTAAEQYTQGTITVDPTAVYDRWPEIQRQEEARKAREAAEEVARLEQARKEEEAARAEQARKEAEEARREKEEQHRAAQRQQAAEEERRAREARAPPTPQTPSHQSKPSAQNVQPSASESGATGSAVKGPPSEADLEAEIRAMMAKMRELNGKDPALLARIWEEERRAKAPKSPAVRTASTPQPVPSVRTTATPQPPFSQVKAVPVTNHSKATATKQDQPPKAGGSAVAKARPAPISTSIPKPPPAKAQPAPMATPTQSPPPAKSAGSTIWPEDKKTQLASAAATYLNSLNPDTPLTSERICTILDGNPSYIVLCEILEGMGLGLDRAAFAKNLINAVPDINAKNNQAGGTAQGAVRSDSHRLSVGRESQYNGSTQKIAVQLPVKNGKAPAYRQESGRNNIIPPAMSSASRLPTFPTSYQQANDPYYPPFPDNSPTTSASPAPMAQMMGQPEPQAELKPEHKPPANKEEAARKRTFSDIVDLTQLSDDTDLDLPPPKKRHQQNELYSGGGGSFQPYSSTPTIHNFPSPVGAPQQQTAQAVAMPVESRFRNVSLVQGIDKKKALRRNTYNIKTIARDVLLACGRHPEERQLNQHLEVLKGQVPGVDTVSDLSTIRWDLIDPGQPPKGYYKERDSVVDVDDADDEDDSDEEAQPSGSRGHGTAQRGVVGIDGASESMAVAHAAHTHAPAPHGSSKNPFRKRGRPRLHDTQAARHGDVESSRQPHQSPRMPQTPTAGSDAQPVSDSHHRSGSATVGYAAFRTTNTGPHGTPLPKKIGRPVGWRKSIHGSAALQAASQAAFTPTQSSGLRKVSTTNEPVVAISKLKTGPKERRPSPPRYQVFKCQWQGCKAELHNLDTLKKHVQKVHRKPTAQGSLECLWDDCGREVTSIDSVTGIRVERQIPFLFGSETAWHQHLEQQHFGPLSWQLGDGPVSGLSDNHDSASEAYLSDSKGRRVTPRIQPSSSRPLEHHSSPFAAGQSTSSAGRGRGRPPRVSQEKEAIEAQRNMVVQKKRIGGPGIDRGGATLVNEKRRRGFVDNEEEEQLIDAED